MFILTNLAQNGFRPSCDCFHLTIEVYSANKLARPNFVVIYTASCNGTGPASYITHSRYCSVNGAIVEVLCIFVSYIISLTKKICRCFKCLHCYDEYLLVPFSHYFYFLESVVSIPC